MFNLFRSREKMVRFFLGAILVVVSLSMLTYLIPSYNSGGSSSDTVVAEIGGDKITVPEVQRAIQNTVRGRQIPPAILPTYVPQIVDQIVTERSLAYEASRLGLQVTDADVADAIRQMVPGLFPDGKFVGKDAYAAMLAQQNTSIAEFENDLKRQILINKLRSIATQGTVVLPAEIDQTYRAREEKIKVEYVKLTSDRFRKEAEPTPAEMESYFKVNAASFRIPERKNLAILVADQAKIEATVNPTDADLERVYNQDQAPYRLPERVHARHILIKTLGKPDSDDAKLKAQAEDLLKQIRGGADFAALAKKNSEDTGSAVKGGDLDWIARGQTVPEFEKMAFSLKPGQTSDLVKTQYGYHIIQVLQHEDARVKPFSEAKADLAKQWKTQRVNQMMQDISDKAQMALQKDPANPDKVAAAFGMQVVRADNVEAGKPIAEIGNSPDFDQSIADLKVGQVSQPVALAGNKIVLASVTAVTPARQANFDEVKDQVRERMVGNRLTALVQERAKQLVGTAKSMNGDLAKAAKSMGLELKTSDAFTRTDTIMGVGSGNYFMEYFSSPDGSVVGPINMPDGTVVARVVAHVAPDMSKLADQRAAIREQIKSQKTRDRGTLFDAGVKDSLIKSGKVKVHQDVINRLVAGFMAG